MKKGKIKSFLKTTSTNLTIAMVTGLTFTSIALASETQLKDYVEPKDPTVTAKDLSELEVDSNLLFDRNFHGYNTWFAKKDGIAISVSDKLDEKYHEATAQNVEYLNRAFELINDDYKFKIVQGEGDIRILPLEDEWISVNRENIDETAYAGVRVATPFSRMVLNKNVIGKVFINTEDIEKGGVHNIRRIILHEIAHMLGLNDVYKDEYNGHTLMNSYAINSQDAKFHQRDFRALAGLYKKPTITKEMVLEALKDKDICADYYRPVEQSAMSLEKENTR